MTVYILWTYEAGAENPPMIMSIHKTKDGGQKELKKHKDGFIISYKVKE